MGVAHTVSRRWLALSVKVGGCDTKSMLVGGVTCTFRHWVSLGV